MGDSRVWSVLGQGGFSKVYRVRDEVEDEERALKLFDNAAGYEAVRREIGALRKVHHPNVVEVFWAGKTDAGEWYLITEYIEGESLDEYATGKQPSPRPGSVDVALDILDALVAIHPDTRADRGARIARSARASCPRRSTTSGWSSGEGLVHRDIKPQNIMLTRTGAKLLDFNIASRVGDPVHTVSGTPPYQPPDADLTRWDVSTDLFAVGRHALRVALRWHSTRTPRPTDARCRTTGSPPVPQGLTVAGGVPAPGLRANDRTERFQTAAEMRSALESVRASL